jgi:hypothetical protein
MTTFDGSMTTFDAPMTTFDAPMTTFGAFCSLSTHDTICRLQLPMVLNFLSQNLQIVQSRSFSVSFVCESM